MRNGSLIKKISEECTREGIALGVAVGIATVLLVAAVGKFLYPLESMENFERMVSLFEFILLGALLYFRNRWQMWLFSAAVFSSWGGYALFWYVLELPCACMGSMVHIPTLFSIIADVFFFVLCLSIARAMGASKNALYLGVLLGFYFTLAGFAFADGIYHYYLWES